MSSSEEGRVFHAIVPIVVLLLYISSVIGFLIGKVSINIVFIVAMSAYAQQEVPKIRKNGVPAYVEKFNISSPSRRDIALSVAGLVSAYTIMFVSGFVFTLVFDSNPASHVISSADLSPIILLMYIISFFLVVAPLEEYCFRHLLHNWFDGGFLRKSVLSNTVFALIHIFVYAIGATSVLGVVQAIVSIFLVAMVFSVVYRRSGNLFTPIIVHGTINSLSILLVYFA